jgi:WD40 repeat protein
MKESIISLNPFKLVKSIRNLVQDRRVRRERKAVIAIQALARGYLCRYRMYRGLIVDVNSSTENDNLNEASSTRFRPNLSIVTDPVELKKRETPRRQKSKPPPSPAQKFLKELTKVSNAASSQLVENAMIGASSIKEAALLAQSATKDYIHKQQMLREMQDRRKRGIVAIQDAMLRINFKTQTAEAKVPKVIGYQCYFCVYPFSALDPRSNPDAQYDVDNDYFLNPTKKVVSHARIHDEAIRSPIFGAFDPEIFESLDLFRHLSDCGRYEGFEIILYMSSIQGSVLTDEQVQETSLKTMLGVVDLSRLKNDGHEMLFTAFFGRCSLKGGAAFPPAGGRKIVTMRPCLPELVGRPFTAALSACSGIELTFTLMPIATPSSHYLSQFRHPKRCDPCYPSILVNGTQLEAGSARWDVFNSAAICASYYKSYVNSSLGTMLVSARNKTSPTGLFEFNCEGDFIKSVSAPSQDIGTILHIISGHRHIACCGNRGNIMYIHEKVPIEIKSDYVPTEIEWMTPIVVPTHFAAITSGCVTSHAGVDIFFTSDKTGNIAVTFLSDLSVVGNCSNAALSKETVVSLHTIDQTLYVFLSDGVLIAVDISAILQGSVGAASELKRYIVFEEQIFHWSSGIHSSCICHSSAFHNIHNADDARRVARKEESNKRLAHGDRKVEDDIMEGHILLVGGGDKDPRVFVFTSTGKGLRRIGKLEGHRAAVTQICCDAAGRYFFTASATDKSIRIWDALLFRCETIYEDVNIGSMAIGFNCLYISSFKAPFLRIWRVFEEADQPMLPPEDESEKHLVSGHYDDSYLKHLYSSYIESTRTLRWCYSIIKEADTSSLKGHTLSINSSNNFFISLVSNVYVLFNIMHQV